MRIVGAELPGERCGPAVVTVENGRILAREETRRSPRSGEVDGRGALLFPGFVDIHLHGAGGGDISLSRELERVAHTLARFGVTAFLPTFYPLPLPDFLAALRQAVVQVGKLPVPTARVAGFHLEGPFLNPKAPGALAPESFLPARIDLLDSILEAAAGQVRLITVAPEIPGAPALIRELCRRGVVVSLGHTVANTREVAAAVKAGATRATHLFNVMPGLQHREPGLVGAAMQTGGVGPELIADGAHVDPAVLALMFRLRGGQRDGLCLVSDALAPAGTRARSLQMFGRSLRVRGGGLLDRDGQLNGSALLLSQGVERLVSAGHLEWRQALRFASENPARVAGLSRHGRIRPGWIADLVLWRDKRPERVWIGGQEVPLG